MATTAGLVCTVDFIPASGASITNVPTDTVAMPPTPTAKSLSITRKIDKSSPTLYSKCSAGTHFNNVVITMRKSGGSSGTYYTVKMTSVTVSGYSRTALTETISLAFSQMTSNLPATAGALA